jgi:hypothetical protein
MLEKPAAIPVAWFRREDYQRVRALSNDEMAPTFEEWEAKMLDRMTRLAAGGVPGEKVIIDPNDLLEFAKRTNAPRIDTNLRAQCAGWLFAKNKGTS